MSELTFDDHGFGTESRRISWHEIVAVGIRTTGDGPFGEDVFWQILLRDGQLELPGSMLGDLDPLAKRLAGFDFAKVITAMGSCEERVFRVWHHEESSHRPDEPALRLRFAQLVERLGARGDASDAFARLDAAWSSASRHYHDVEHLTDCLREIDRLAASPSRDRIELALWYHDAVYDAGASDCEHRSAVWLASDADALGLPASVAKACAALVEATAHGTRGAGDHASDEADVMLDIDLSILGRDPLRFMDFEHGVAEEFAAIPKLAFRRGRGRFLAKLLERPLYRTASFRDRFEATARTNIAALLESRRYAAYRWLRWIPC